MTTPPKNPKASRPDFADAHRACRTTKEREQLSLVMHDSWTSAELTEFARLHHFKNGRDYPTPTSYRRAIADIANCRMLSYAEAEPYYGQPRSWLKLFREGGSKPLSPRREGALQRGRGLAEIQCEYLGLGSIPNRVQCEEYAWPGHSEEYRSMIEQRARDYFHIAPEQPVHVNAWAASQRAYWREQEAEAKAKAPKVQKKPRKKPHKLAPQFNRDWPGHTDAFRQEVDQRVRDDRRLPPGAYVGPGWWKIACNKYYELTDVATE